MSAIPTGRADTTTSHLRRGASCLLFGALLFGLTFFSPGYLMDHDGAGVAVMGYTAETLAFSNWLLDASMDRQTSPAPRVPRHGPVEALAFLPFVALSRLFANSGIRNFIVSLEPIVATALLGTVFFRWLSALVGARHAALWTAAAVFCTMLWPYAYIGLETTQSLFLLLTGYLALGPCRLPTVVRIPLLGLCAGLAVAAKAGGVMLAPGVGFVLVVSCWRVSARLSVRAMWLIGAVVLAGAVLSAAAHWRNLELGRGVGGAFSLDPLSWSMNLLGLLLSLNKGLVVYAPLVLLALVGFRHAWRRQPQLTVFAAVSLAGLAGGLALFYFWAEETWGPRYLHSAVAGLMLVAAVGTARRWRRHRFAFVSLAVVGAIVSLLGCLFHYGVLFHTARPLTPLTTERLQGDATLNPVIFHLRLVVAVWQRSWHPESSVPYPWSARGHRWFPKDGQRGFPRDGDGTPSTADLRDIAHLQPEVIKVFASPSSHAIWILRSFYSCLLLGTLATGLALWRLCLNDARVPR